ncbi:MAG: helicase HerA-like domain-containing protein [Polyangiaceae bacterium]
MKSPLNVFHAIEHRHEISRYDPFDIESIHAEARADFHRLLSLATTPPGEPRGRILLVRGNAGSGKTHLLRAFRNEVHSTRAGLVGYMPMPSQSNNLTRHVLSNLIDSLDQPYDDFVDTRSGLVRLAGILASRAFAPSLANFLRDEPDLDLDEVAALAVSGAEKLVAQDEGRYAAAGLHLLQALLLLHRPDPRLKARVLMYLRCEDLAETDRNVLGGLKPRTGEDDPRRMIIALGRLAWAVGNMALVVCLDQLETTWTASGAEGSKRVMQALFDLAEDVPSSIFVVACLDDIFVAIESALFEPYRERVREDTTTCFLNDKLTRDQAQDLIARRLRYLYSSCGIAPGSFDPVFPFGEQFFLEHSSHTSRTLLSRAREYRDACRKANQLLDSTVLTETARPQPPPGSSEIPSAPGTEQAHLAFEQKWTEALAHATVILPDADDEKTICDLLAWAIAGASRELESGWRFSPSLEDIRWSFSPHVNDSILQIEARRNDRVHERTWVAVCNKTPRFGWLARQIDGYSEHARKSPENPRLVLLRNSDFSRAAAVNKAISAVIRGGGRTVVVPHGDWRAILAFREFQSRYKGEPHFYSWAMEERPLSQLPSIRSILDLDHIEQTTSAPVEASPTSPVRATFRPLDPAAVSTEPSGPAPLDTPMFLGQTKGVAPEPITMVAAELTRHVAFLGATGSGKTTLALSIIEQLLQRGVPVLMIDRKGDLAGYARRSIWTHPHTDSTLDARRRTLADTLDINLYTPGHPLGRPLSIALAPDGLRDLEEIEREEASTCAASALAEMLGYRNAGRDKALRAILLQAFQVLASFASASRIDLEAIIQLIDAEDPALVAAVGKLDTRLFRQIVQDAETLKLTTTHLFSNAGEPLDVDRLFGTGPFAQPGRTRLSIISTKFLRDESQSLFWIAQLLLAINRWTTRNPKNYLQAAVMFDEADLYLPAVRRPVTKTPMENLLKRSRSAGLGVLLATQSPGDLDYRCRDNIQTWFVGRVREATAIAKLRPMLEGAAGSPLERLPDQSTGEFCAIAEQRQRQFQAACSFLATEQIPDDEILVLARETFARSS